jgi:hypothetical protein
VQFTKRLRDPIKRGEITCSVRIWQRPRVKVNGRYRLDDGYVVVDAVRQIEFDDITLKLARRSGFNGVAGLLKVAKHGPGEQVYLIEFHYESQAAAPAPTG